MVGNRDLVHALARMKSYHDYGTFTPIQVASIIALEGPQDRVEQIRLTYQRRRDVMCAGLEAAGWRVEKPRATMYVWAPPLYINGIGTRVSPAHRTATRFVKRTLMVCPLRILDVELAA